MNTEYTVIIPFICFIYMLYVCFITRCMFANRLLYICTVLASPAPSIWTCMQQRRDRLRHMQWHTMALVLFTSRCSSLNDSNRCSDIPRRLIGLPHDAHFWMTQTDAVTHPGAGFVYLTMLISDNDGTEALQVYAGIAIQRLLHIILKG